MEGAVGIVVLLAWVAPAIVGALVGQTKGRGGAGFLLGFFLSWIGVLAALFLENYVAKEQHHRELMAAVGSQGKVAMPHSVVKVRCPSCSQLVHETARFCPECAGALSPIRS